MTRLTKFCQAADHLKRGGRDTAGAIAMQLEVDPKTAAKWINLMRKLDWIEPKGTAKPENFGRGLRPVVWGWKE